MKAALARARLRGAEHDDVGEAKARRHIGQACARHERHLDARQAAFVELVEALEGDIGDNGAQDGIAQKLQALVGILHRTAFGGRWMRDGGQDELLVGKRVAQNLLRPLQF